MSDLTGSKQPVHDAAMFVPPCIPSDAGMLYVQGLYASKQFLCRLAPAAVLIYDASMIAWVSPGMQA